MEETNPLEHPLESIPENIVINDKLTWRFIEDKVGPYWHGEELYPKLLDKYVQMANDERQRVVAKRQQAHKDYLRDITKARDVKNWSFDGPDKREITRPRVEFQGKYIPLPMIDTETLREYSQNRRRRHNPFEPAFPDYIRKPTSTPSTTPSLYQAIRSFFTPLGHV